MTGPAAEAAVRPSRFVVRVLLLLATSTPVVCGVKGPPRPPSQEADAGAPSAPAAPPGAAADPDGGASRDPAK